VDDIRHNSDADYRRRARRIRAIWRGNPQRTQTAIAQLASGRLNKSEISPRHANKIDWSQSAILGHRSAAAREFADLVAQRLVGDELPWNQRQTLLIIAHRFRISRFEANLIIAAAQHHLRRLPPAIVPRHTRRPISIPAMLAIALSVEMLALGCAWHFLF
jgi:hypothetical protein